MHSKHPEVIRLRKKGKSYREIARDLDVSKSSISQWCKNLKLPLSAQKILEKKNKWNKEVLVKNNRLKSERVKKENQKIKKKAIREIRPLSKYELLLIGAALYWAEGYRKQDKMPTPHINFANSDPNMIALFLRFLREIILVPEEKIRVRILIHPNINERATINFWSQITNIPKERFYINRQVSRASQRKRPFNSLPHGTLDLRVSSRQKFFQIKGWIDGLIKHNI